MEGSTGNQSEKQVTVVTGGNRGIGLEICKQLASNGVTVVLTARDEKRGVEVIGALGQSNVVFHQLEVSDPSSAACLADFIKEKFGNLDILVNNAGIAGTTWNVDDPEIFRQKLANMDLMERIETINKHITESYEEAEKCLRTNYHGIAVVTGGNRGIGLTICKQLASNGVTVILTARDEKRGAEAIGTLGQSNVLFHQLEVSDPSSAARLADFIKEKFGKLDILVNNAGIAGRTWRVDDPEIFRQKLAGMAYMERIETMHKHIMEPYEEAEKCLRTNYHGTKVVTKALLPLLQSSSHGRIVNMSSYYGLLRFFSGDELKEELNNIDSLSEQRLDELSELFLKEFKDGQLELRGWPKQFTAYKVSKALMNAYSRILAKEHPSMCINCVHPGYVKTDMNFQVGQLTVEEGARGALMMAMAPKGGVTGAYLDKTEVASFV